MNGRKISWFAVSVFSIGGLLAALIGEVQEKRNYRTELSTLLSDFCVLQTGKPEHMYMKLSDGKVYFCADKHGNYHKLRRGDHVTVIE